MGLYGDLLGENEMAPALLHVSRSCVHTPSSFWGFASVGFRIQNLCFVGTIFV